MWCRNGPANGKDGSARELSSISTCRWLQHDRLTTNLEYFRMRLEASVLPCISHWSIIILQNVFCVWKHLLMDHAYIGTIYTKYYFGFVFSICFAIFTIGVNILFLGHVLFFKWFSLFNAFYSIFLKKNHRSIFTFHQKKVVDLLVPFSNILPTNELCIII